MARAKQRTGTRRGGTQGSAGSKTKRSGARRPSATRESGRTRRRKAA